MEKYSISEVIEQAVQTEKLGFDFYTGMGAKFPQESEFKKLFDTLAKKEKTHEQRFQELKKIVHEESLENWDEVSLYLRAIVEGEFFLGKQKTLSNLETVHTVEDAIRFAIGFEKETLLYFYGVRDLVKEKDVVDEIINEEKSHIMWLSRFQDSIKKK